MIDQTFNNLKNKNMDNNDQVSPAGVPTVPAAPAAPTAPTAPVETKTEDQQPGYFFPTHGITIQADTEEEANAKLEQHLASLEQNK